MDGAGPRLSDAERAAKIARIAKLKEELAKTLLNVQELFCLDRWVWIEGHVSLKHPEPQPF